jgi:hypothetical protein
VHHVVQENLSNEVGYKQLLDALEASNCQYTIVKVLAHARRGDVIDHNFGNEIVFAHELDFPADEKVMVWGGLTLDGIAQERGWKPGCFQNEHFDMRYLNKRFGGYMLNDDAVFCTFAEMEFDAPMFCRPVHDTKTFSGTVIHPEELAEWKSRVIHLSNTGYSMLTADTPVMYATPKTIELEARLFIVDGTIVSGSSYRSLGRQVLYQRIDGNNPLFHPLLNFARAMLYIDFAEDYGENWGKPIAEAFVMDVCQIGNEHRIVEVNCLNSAGFYATDMGAVVRALEAMEF